MKKNSVSVAVLLALAGVAAGASAQQAVKPGGIEMGPMMAYPAIDVSLKHDDNIFSRPVGETSSAISVIAPSVRFEAKSGPHEFNVNARVEDGTVHKSRADNYTDYQLGADASWVFSGRTGLKLKLDHMHGHDARGSNVGAGIGASPDEYDSTGFSGVFGYGAEGAQGRIELDGSYLDKRYTNNGFLTVSSGTRFSNREESRYGASFFWRVMPKTQLVFAASEGRYDYNDSVYDVPSGLIVRDSKERRYMVGVTWEATYKTTGIFKVGHVKKDFSNAALTDFSGVAWEGSVKWSPLTYSTFDLLASKKPNESTLGGASFDRVTGLSWNHAWSSRLASAVSYTNTRSDYKGGVGQNNLVSDRRDTIDAFGAKLTYQAMRWLKVGAAYDYTDKKSSTAGGGYDRNLFTLFLGATL